LAAGIKKISGNFQAGDVVSIVGLNGSEFAKGMVGFSSYEVNRIKGLRTNEIEEKLDCRVSHHEVVHKDKLVILG